MRNLRGVKKEKKRKKIIVQIVSFWILGLLVREKTIKKQSLLHVLSKL